MVFDQIDQLKRKYTDKYVVVDGQRPELARFRDTVGRVKTVNMSGRALVEFDDYHLNIGWYDIDLEFLKVVDKPAPKPKEAPAKEPAAKKPAGAVVSAAGASPTKPAPQPAAGKPSVADILAAARGGGASGSAPAAPAKAKTPVAPAPPAVEEVAESDSGEVASAGGESVPAKAPSGETIDKKSMSIADMCAWCKSHDAK